MRNNMKWLMLGCVALATAAVGCGSDDDAGKSTSGSTLSLTLTGLDPVGPDYVYEGWIMVDGAPVSTGRFDVDAGKTKYDFTVTEAQAAAAAAFILSIEPKTGDDPAPSKTKVLGGDISGMTATLSTSHAAALGTDFTSAAGKYILETPTTGAIADDYDQGVWFLVMNAGTPSASLTLPDLPEGWMYEGWVVGASGPTSTGRFTMAAGADSDGAGSGAGTDGAPPFPGQDFINPAEVLAGSDRKVVISVEPEPDDSAAPFALKPLVDGEVMDVGAGTPQDLENMSAGAPSGSVTLQ